jgi:hypothetical protein
MWLFYSSLRTGTIRSRAKLIFDQDPDSLVERVAPLHVCIGGSHGSLGSQDR